MADTQRSVSDIIALLADNSTGSISPQDLRDAFVTWRPAHGQIYISEANGAAVTIANTADYVEVTEPVWTLDSADCHLFDESAGNGRLTYVGNSHVMAHIASTISMTAESSNQVLHVALGITGTVNEKGEIHHKILVNSDVRSTALHLIAHLDPGDYVSLWVRNITSTADVYFTVANLQLMTMPM